jgi:predicted DNA-binding transcriptional regulator AlpA
MATKTENDRPATTEPTMVDKRWIAKTLGCSERHVDRLADGGLMPPPSKLGRLCRWNRKAIEKWIEAGCPAVRNTAE